MKRLTIFLICMVMILGCFGQTQVRADEIVADQRLFPPIKDTTTAPKRVGELRVRVQDTSLYIGLSITATKKWQKILKLTDVTMGGGGIISIGAVDGGTNDAKGMNTAGGILYGQSSDGTNPGFLTVAQYKRQFTVQTSANPTGTITHNQNLGGQHKMTFTSTGGRTLAFSNLVAGDITILNFDNTSGAAVTLTLPSNSFINFASAASATIPEDKSALSLSHFDGTNYWFIQNYEAVTGQAGQVAFFNTNNTITGDNGFFWDNANKIAGIGTVSPSVKAVLELSSANKGFIIPRLTAAQRTGITSPGAGQWVFDTDSSRLFGHDGTNWKGVRWTWDAAGGGGGGTPGGSSGNYQYNNGGAFDGDAGSTFASGTSPNRIFQSMNAAHVAMVIKGSASQSTNLQEWQNSTGTVLGRVNQLGYMFLPAGSSTAPSLSIGATSGIYDVSGVALGLWNSSVGNNTIIGHNILLFKTATSAQISFGNSANFGTTEGWRFSSPATGTIKSMFDGSGTNNAATSVVQENGKSTGNAIPASWTWRTSVPGASGSTAQTVGDRLQIVGNYTTLTEATATAFVRVNVPSSTVSGGTIVVTVEANDATDFQSRTLLFTWTAVNKAGTTTITVGTPDEVAAVSAGTLTVTITATDAGSGNIDFKADASSSLTQTVLRANYQVTKNFGTGAITPQ